MPKTRITITIPEELLAAADRRARELDRSRSWIIADTLERGLAVPPSSSGAVPDSRPMVLREPGGGGYGVVDIREEVAEARRLQLLADLRLSPTDRIRHAESLGGLGRGGVYRSRRAQVIGFESHEDYEEWKQSERIRVPGR